MEKKETPISSDSSANSSSVQENFILQALANVHKLILYKLGASHQDSIEDLSQRIFYKIWLWRHRNKKELELQEWQKVINVTVNTEVSEYFSERPRREILFSQAGFNLQEEMLSTESSPQTPEGNSETELRSLLLSIWKTAHILSLRQRYAFLLHNPDFLVEFVMYECCTGTELAAFFEMTAGEISDVLKFLPLSDEKIAIILETKIKEKVSPNQLWEARAKAKKKLSKILKDYSYSGFRQFMLIIFSFLCSVGSFMELDTIVSLMS